MAEPAGSARDDRGAPHGRSTLPRSARFVRAHVYVAGMLVRELTDGCEIDQVLLVREVEVRQKRDGREFLKLALGDRTGSVAATIWDGVAELLDHIRPGVPVRVIGRYADHPRYGAEITVRALRRPADGSFDPADLLDGPPRRPGRRSATRRPRRSTTRPTATGCWSTR